MSTPEKVTGPPPPRSAPPWQRFGNVAQFLSPLVAVITAMVAGVYVFTQIEANRQTAARQMFRSHLELEMKYPAFAEPDFEAIKKAGKSDLYQYGSFINHLLYTCEELTIATREDAAWRASCEMRLKMHAPYLCAELSKEELETYDARIQRMIVSTRCQTGCRADTCSNG